MAEQLAENYHNTWGRKKKLELQAKGQIVVFFRDGNLHMENERLGFCLLSSRVLILRLCVQEVEHILYWSPMTLWQQKKRHETEKRPTSCSSSCS